MVSFGIPFAFTPLFLLPQIFLSLGMVSFLQIPTTILDSETMQILAQNKDALGSLQFALYLFGVIIVILVIAQMAQQARHNKRVTSLTETTIRTEVRTGTLEKVFEKFAEKVDDLVVAMNKQPELIAKVQVHDSKIAKLEENQSNIQSQLL